MRKTCSQCASKHLGQARALLLEARKGYPDHYWFALGHLAEAEDELEAEYPALTATIRQHRKALEADPDYRVPFSALVLAVAGQTGYDLTEYWKPCFVRRLAMKFSKFLKFFAPLLVVGAAFGEGLQIVGAPVDNVAREQAAIGAAHTTESSNTVHGGFILTAYQWATNAYARAGRAWDQATNALAIAQAEGIFSAWLGTNTYVKVEADTLQSVVTRSGAVTAGDVTIDEANERSNTYGGYIVTLGTRIQQPECTASGDYGATALGESTTASGTAGATALGSGTLASGDYGAMALGESTTASGASGATALGSGTLASGDLGATALGFYTTASGNNGATALGYSSIASNDSSFAWGSSETPYGSHGIGSFNINPIGGLSGFWIGETNFSEFLDLYVPKALTNDWEVGSHESFLTTNGSGSGLTGITAAQVGAVPTSRTITVNGQVGSLDSNVAFNTTLQQVLDNGNTATNDTTIGGRLTVGNTNATYSLVVTNQAGQNNGFLLEWPQVQNWLNIWSHNTVKASSLSCPGEFKISPDGDTVITRNLERVRVSSTGFSVYNQNAVFGRHSNGYTPVSTVEVFGNLRVTQTNSIIGINARSDAGPAAITNAAQFFATNAAAAEMFVMDGAGNVTQLSTHEGLTHVAKSWNVYTGTGRVIDLDALADAVQQLTGRNDIVRDLSLVPVDWDAEQEGKRQARITEQAKADEEIAKWEADKSNDKPPKPTRPPDYVKAAKPKWLQDWERETKENE